MFTALPTSSSSSLETLTDHKSNVRIRRAQRAEVNQRAIAHPGQQILQDKSKEQDTGIPAQLLISTDVGGPAALTDPRLKRLAKSLAGCEFEVFFFAYFKGTYAAEHEPPDNPLVVQHHTLGILLKQLLPLLRGSKDFVADYILMKEVLDVYRYAETWMPNPGSTISETFESTLPRTMALLDDELDETIELFIDAFVEGAVEEETGVMFRQKCQALRRLTTSYAQAAGIPPRSPNEWSAVRRQIRLRIEEREDRSPDKAKRLSALGNLKKPKGVASIPSCLNGKLDGPARTALNLFLIAVPVLCSGFFYGMARHFSSDQSGSTDDADFWMLLQSSVMQYFSFIVSGMSWRSKQIPTFIWLVPTIAATIATITGLVLYVHVPSHWSALATTFGSCIQALILVALSVYGE